MGAQGTVEIDFGAFPGKSDASVVVTGQAGIVAGSLVEAWLRPAATADHTADEHMVETLKVVAANIVAGNGFTVYGFNTSELSEPLERLRGRGGGPNSPAILGQAQSAQGLQTPTRGGRGTRLYGKWLAAWVWN